MQQKFHENELGEEKIKQLLEQPIIKSTIQKSADGKWLIHKTIMIDIKPVNYYSKCLAQDILDNT